MGANVRTRARAGERAERALAIYLIVAHIFTTSHHLTGANVNYMPSVEGLLLNGAVYPFETFHAICSNFANVGECGLLLPAFLGPPIPNSLGYWSKRDGPPSDQVRLGLPEGRHGECQARSCAVSQPEGAALLKNRREACLASGARTASRTAIPGFERTNARTSQGPRGRPPRARPYRSRGPEYRQCYRAETCDHLRARLVVRVQPRRVRRAANALATAISSLSADAIASAIACMRLSRLKANSRSCSRAATRRAASRRKLPSAVLAASAAVFNSTRNDAVIVIVFRRMAEESGSRTHQGPARGPSRI